MSVNVPGLEVAKHAALSRADDIRADVVSREDLYVCVKEGEEAEDERRVEKVTSQRGEGR